MTAVSERIWSLWRFVFGFIKMVGATCSFLIVGKEAVRQSPTYFQKQASKAYQKLKKGQSLNMKQGHWTIDWYWEQAEEYLNP